MPNSFKYHLMILHYYKIYPLFLHVNYQFCMQKIIYLLQFQVFIVSFEAATTILLSTNVYLYLSVLSYVLLWLIDPQYYLIMPRWA